MQIDIKLNRNFMIAYNKMQNEYGTEFAQLNGFSDKQLSYTDFIDNFVGSDTVADASIDGNANVGNKDIRTLMNEMPKSHRKLLSFNKIYQEINDAYGFQVANKWFELEWTKALYLHDADTSTFIHYCFDGDTEILTSDGIKKLRDINGTDIKVLNKYGGFEDASVKCFGKQPLYKLVLSRYGNEKTIYTTANHKWFVEDRKTKKRNLVDTINLSEGDRIPFNVGKIWNKVKPSPFGVAHGFYTGDGTKTRNVANFCGNKVDIMEYFSPFTVGGNRNEYTIGGIPNYFNELPPLTETTNYLFGWLAGYFAADGSIDDKGRCSISSTNKENLVHVQNVLCVLGMPVNDIKEINRVSNLTEDWHTMYTLTLSSEYLTEDFFVRQDQKEKRLDKERKHRAWSVVSVEKTNRVDDVYCAVVPNSESFTLMNNVLTHNCYAYDLKDLAEKGLYFLNTFNHEPPKHLSTFVDFIKEFISFASNRSSGAVGLPNVIPYMYYFWKKDCETGYATKSDDYYARQQIQRFIYAINQPYVRDGLQSAFTNVSIFDGPYLEALFGGATFPDGSFMIDSLDEIKEFQKLFMEVVSEIRSHNMFTFPVLTMSLLRQNGKFVDEDFARWCNEHNRKWADSNFFVDDSVTSLSNCCRLKSDVSDMIDDELGYFNSIGGTALSVGSVKVSSINLARIALEYKTEESFLERLKEVVVLDCIVLDVVRNIIKSNVEKNLMPNFSKGLVDFKHLYNTVGFTGIYETMKRFGYITVDELGNTFYTKEAENFGQKIFNVIHDIKDEFAKDKDYKINLEQIPGETACAKMFKADSMLYPRKTIKDLPLYGNQFLPLGIKATLQERTRIASLFDTFCNGGSIQHINIEAPFDSEQKAWDMLNWVADMGVTYFAFNYQINACENNHAFFTNVCPVCGKPVHTKYTRIVGFFTPIKSWSKERKSEGELREWHNVNEDINFE